MSGITDLQSYVEGQTDSVGASASATKAAVNQWLRIRRIVFPKTSAALGTNTADAMANTTTAETQAATIEVAGTLLAIYLVANAALTADPTNNATITLSKRTSAGGSKTTVASAVTTAGGTGSWAQGQAVPIALTATVADRSFAAGSTFSFEVAKGGSGVAVPAGNFVIVYQED